MFPRIASVRPMPGEMPEWRDWLMTQWEPFGVFAQVMVARQERDDRHTPGPGNPSVASMWDRHALGKSELFYVAEPMCDLMIAASHSVPVDVRQQDLVPVCPRGLVIFEKSWIGRATEGQPIEVDALCWGPVALPPLTADDPPDETVPALGISTYGLYGMNGGIGKPFWCALGRSDWPERVSIGEAPWEMPDEIAASYVEDRQVVAALWTLLHQEGIAKITYPPRAEQRRAERYVAKHGGPEEGARVRLVTLRDVEGHRSRTNGEGRTLDHRFPVSGHWRNQPHGPGRTLRRLQYIDPYIKGPEGTELVVPEVVKVWKR